MKGAEVSGRKHTMKPDEFLCFRLRIICFIGGRWQINN